MARHIDEEAQQLLTDYRDNRARQKMLDNKAIYKRYFAKILYLMILFSLKVTWN